MVRRKRTDTSLKKPPILSGPLRSIEASRQAVGRFTKPTADFTQALAREIVRNLTNIGQFTTRPFRRPNSSGRKMTIGESPILLDTSILIDGRILPIVNSGFLAGTLVIPQFVLGEVQHIADSSDSLRRAKGRRGLEVALKLKGQKANSLIKYKVVTDDIAEQQEVDHKLVILAKRWKGRLLTVDYNLASLARSHGVKVLNIMDLAQALKVSVVPGEEIQVKITHEGKEREQGVGYLADGTMIVVDGAKHLIDQVATVVITKVHHTPAGQLFFARLPL